MSLTLLALLSLTACDTDPEGTNPDDTAGSDTGAAVDTAVDTASSTTDNASNPYGDAEATGCPVLSSGRNALTSAGLEREAVLVLPDNPEGAPVVFAWHWLGGTADQILNWMEMEKLAAEGAIVVAPDSTRMLTEWDYLAAPDQSIDALLFDDLLTCLWDSYRIDTDRVFAAGMSAGGLMTSYLTMHRSSVLAATVPFSGGVISAYYEAPEVDLPVMLVWGGVSDSYGGYDFHGATLSFSSALQSDGSFVVECEHDLGHLPPDGAADMAWAFFESHPMSIDAEPWADALPGTLPDYCRLP